MGKIYKCISIFFVILTFIGAGYVLINKGNVNAGYAVIPMLGALIFNLLYRRLNPLIGDLVRRLH